jgi:hypothetical protein
VKHERFPDALAIFPSMPPLLPTFPAQALGGQWESSDRRLMSTPRDFSVENPDRTVSKSA